MNGAPWTQAAMAGRMGEAPSRLSSHVYSRPDLTWRPRPDGTRAPHVYGRADAIVHVVPDMKHTEMWRIAHPDGHLSDIGEPVLREGRCRQRRAQHSQPRPTAGGRMNNQDIEIITRYVFDALAPVKERIAAAESAIKAESEARQLLHGWFALLADPRASAKRLADIESAATKLARAKPNSTPTRRRMKQGLLPTAPGSRSCEPASSGVRLPIIAPATPPIIDARPDEFQPLDNSGR